MDTNSKTMTNRVKHFLDIFDKTGIASRERFNDVRPANHPNILSPNFKSVIVYAKGSSSNSREHMGEFDDYLGTVAAQSDVIDYLYEFGYKTVVVEGSHKNISLVRMGIEAGVGEISPVDSLVVKGLGLTAKLGAMVTNAPLEPDDKVTDVCINCMKCLRVCPIRDTPNAKGDLNKCACGQCVTSCPV